MGGVDGIEAGRRPAASEDSGGVVRPRTSLPELLQQAVDDARRFLKVDVAIVYLTERTDDSLYWAYDSGLAPRAHADSQIEPVNLQDGMTGLAIQSGRVVVTENYIKDDRFLTPERRRLNAEHLGTNSVVAVPMFGDAGPLGVLCAFDRRHRTFTEPELAMLRAFAAHSAFAIENARLSRGLIAAEARYRYLVEGSPDVVWSIDAQGRFTFVNATCERLLGWSADELIGLDPELVHHPSTDAEIHRQLDDQRAHPDKELLFRCNLKHRDGHAVPVELHMIATVVDGRWAGAHGSVRDTAERDRMERELRAQAIELAASRERAYLAQELHDSVTQALFGMTLTSRAAEMLLRSDPGAVGEKLSQLRELAQEALAEMRALIFEMRPGSLADEGLAAALSKHVAAVESRTGLPIMLEADEVRGLNLGLEEALYRVCQEALHNVVKHAAAHQASIEVRQDGDRVFVIVTDDGVGFDPLAVAGEGSGHLGLAGMRARIERFGGHLDIQSAPGSGTRLEATVPATGTAAS